MTRHGGQVSGEIAETSCRSPVQDAAALPGESPIDAPKSRDEIEVPVLAQEGKRILPTKRGNPQIVGWDGFAFCFQFETDGRIAMSGFLVDFQNSYRTHPITQPTFVGSLCAEIARFQAGIRPEQLQAPQDNLCGRRCPARKGPGRLRQTKHWYPGSTPHVRIDLFGI